MTPCTNRKRPHEQGALQFLSPCTESLRSLLGGHCFTGADLLEAENVLASMTAVMSAEMFGERQIAWSEIVRRHAAGTELVSRLQCQQQTAEATQLTPQSLLGSPLAPARLPSLEAELITPRLRSRWTNATN